MNTRKYANTVYHPHVPYPPWHDDGRTIYGQQTQHPPMGSHYAWNEHVIPPAPTPTAWGPITPNAAASDSTTNTDTCTSCGTTVNSKKGKPRAPSITATITTTKTTKTTTRKQIHMPNPAIDSALRNLNHEVHSSLRAYQPLLNSFLVQTALLRSTGSIDDKTLDAIWRSKINTKVTEARNPHQKRERIEFVGARVSYHRQSIQEAVDTARNSLSLLDHVHTADEEDHSGKSKSSSDDEGSGASITISRSVMDKLKLLQRQVRVAERALDYCDAFASLRPERGAVEYMVGYDIVRHLKQMVMLAPLPSSSEEDLLFPL